MYLSTSTFDVATCSFFTPAPLSRAFPLSTFDPSTYASKGESQLQRWSSLIGIITAIVGNILISFALNIQRYAHIRLHEARVEKREKGRNIGKRPQNGYGTIDRNSRNGEVTGHDSVEEDDPLQHSYQSADSQSSDSSDNEYDLDSSYLKSPYWWGGIVLMTVGEAGNFLAYGFAPASIVSPLGVVALVSNCVIAPIMLKERFRMRDFWGVVVAVAGAVTVVLSAKQQEKKLGPHEIVGAITTLEFEVYMAVTITLIVVLIWASPRYGNKTILVDLGLVGLFGGYTALSTKGVASMLSYTLWRALTTPVTYALLAVLISTAVMQVKYVNKALQRFDSTQVIPVQFVMFTLSVIIGSAILYRDFEKAEAENVIKFVGGCLLTFFGVFLITSGRSRNDEDDEEDSEEADETIGLTAQDEEEVFSDGAPRHASIRRRSKAGPFSTGDSTIDDEGPLRSRRSSKVSFVDPRPRTPRLYSNSSHQPSIRVAPPAELPADTEDTPLLTNPWKKSSEELLQVARHPGVQSTTSSPVLPSEAQLSSESLRPPTARSSTQSNFHTHPNYQQGPAPPQGDRPVTPARHSISRMMPGPLLSPLSGGLSVVVADSLRRGIESPLRSKAFRKARLGLRRTKSGGHKLGSSTDDGEDELGTSPLKQSVTNQDVSKSLENEDPNSGSWSRTTRARSLSNTLGDLIMGKRQKLELPDSERDEEAGPSGP
ncbi:nipa 2 [Hyphodiscus hymeniophilus]|uniref:Nipa 2 n=1 Tax=Hyphodiscus hymeniophilus TaxID=353542 RepID=A0A9P6VPX1_9HELO|nr:nipa 2 [Hyphodiscus hymeniophilus]